MANLILERVVTLLLSGRPNVNTGLSDCNVWTESLIIMLNHSLSIVCPQAGLGIRCF